MSNNSHPADSRDFLVIGYGNTLRGDDGVGPRVAEAIEKLNLPGVRTLDLPAALARTRRPDFAGAHA